MGNENDKKGGARNKPEKPVTPDSLHGESGSQGSVDLGGPGSQSEQFHSENKENQTKHNSGGVEPPEAEIVTLNEEQFKTLINAFEKVSTSVDTVGEKIDKVATQLELIRERIFGYEEQTTAGGGSRKLDTQIEKLAENRRPLVDQLREGMDGIIAVQKNEMEMMAKMRQEIGGDQDTRKAFQQVLEAYIEQTESQIPEQLRNPTEKRMFERLTKGKTSEERERLREELKSEGTIDGRGWGSVYQEEVEKWFEERIGEMEEIELSFEEQQETYLILSRYVNSFVLTSETELLGKELRKKLETRRILQRVTRIWNLAGPENIVNEASRISYPVLVEILKQGGPGVQKELQNFERMGRILRERKDSLRDELRKSGNKKPKTPLEIALKAEIKAKELYILDYYKAGGLSEEDLGMEEAYVGSNKYNGKFGSESNDNREGFFYQLGKRGHEYKAEDRANLVAEKLRDPNLSREDKIKLQEEYRKKIYARKVLSLTLRAAYHDILLNGTGDFYAARIMNFADRLQENKLMRDSKDIWDSTGAFKPFDLGFKDLITDITGGLEDENKLDRVGIIYGDGGKKDMRGESLRTLENFQWCSDDNGESELWDKVLAEPDTAPKDAAVTVRMTYFVNADVTRKRMWGADSYFHKPSKEGLVSFEGVYDHMGTSEASYEVMDKNGIPMLDKNGIPIEIRDISGVEMKWIEHVDRHCYWLTTEAGERVTSNPITGFAEKAEIRAVIVSMVKNGMIDGKVRDILLEKYLGTSKRWKLDMITMADVLWNDFKMNYGRMSFEAFIEFLKRAFGYVFSDDFRG